MSAVPDDAIQLAQTVEMFEAITQSQPQDYQSLEILKEAYVKLGREEDLIRTAKRIANAYAMMGQISSAIFELESVLQRRPDDPEAKQLLEEIGGGASAAEEADALAAETARKSGPGIMCLDDGQKEMVKLFVDGRVISSQDFELCWSTPDYGAAPGQIMAPFVQRLADKSILPVERSLRLIADKSRLAYLSLDRYDVDLELARSFPAEICQRWCILPFDRFSKCALIATANPFNKQAIIELEENAKHRFLWYLAAPEDITRQLRKVFR